MQIIYIVILCSFLMENDCVFLCTDQLNKALDIMNQAVSGQFVPGMKENIAYFTHTERRQMDTQSHSTYLQQTPAISATQSRIGPEVNLQL